MSEYKVALMRGAYAAFNARDIEAVIAYFDPGIEFYPLFAAVGGTVYHGHDGVRAWYRDLADTWGEIRLDAEAFFDLGERTLAFCVYRGRGQQSGAEVAMPAAFAYRWRDGLIVYLKSYADREDALRDLGVSEDELEPIEP